MPETPEEVTSQHTVWTLLFITRYGTSVTVFASEEAALGALDEYVIENWDRTPVGTAMPSTREARCAVYTQQQNLDYDGDRIEFEPATVQS